MEPQSRKRHFHRMPDPFPSLAIPLDTPPMEASLAFRDGDAVELMSKSGKPLARYFPEVAEALRQR